MFSPRYSCKASGSDLLGRQSLSRLCSVGFLLAVVLLVIKLLMSLLIILPSFLVTICCKNSGKQKSPTSKPSLTPEEQSVVHTFKPATIAMKAADSLCHCPGDLMLNLWVSHVCKLFEDSSLLNIPCTVRVSLPNSMLSCKSTLTWSMLRMSPLLI